MIAGGEDDDLPFDTVEFFNPSTNRWINELSETTDSLWSTLPDMNETRAEHTATLLTDGRVLVSGGLSPDFLDLDNQQIIRNFRKSAEVYDPISNTWILTNDMNFKRAGHTANLLPNGSVLIVGGATSNELEDQNSLMTVYHKTTEIFDPDSESVTKLQILQSFLE